jgi:cardiolipin synthase A/B
MIEALADIWHYVVAALSLLLALVASGHAVIYKRDTRGALLWVGLIMLAPLVGPVLYFLLGVNRIRRQALQLRAGMERLASTPSIAPCSAIELTAHLPEEAAHLVPLCRTVSAVARRPLLPGNRIETLVNGDSAYPAMLQAIDQARQSVTLATYIFDRGKAGGDFIQALAGAVERGVEVRVLIDDTGARYSWPSVVRDLRNAGVRTARFLPTFAPSRFLAINLRNHRKILVADGCVGFTGGMNIRDGHLVKSRPKRPVQDLHFRIEGPAVAQLQEVFAEDWQFTTGESLNGERWFPPLAPAGPVITRGITDGPDEDIDHLRLTLLAALACARERVIVLTPYFLPDQSLISALNLASMRGVKVDIVLPGRNNLPFVHWACVAHLWQMLERGCRVWFTPPPFDHSKLMLVDGHWALIGSANWDPRSLRLNFELNLECYDRGFCAELEAIMEAKLKTARRVPLAEVNARELPVKLRDGLARLLTPFL